MLLIDKKISRRAKKGIENCFFNKNFFQSLLNSSISAQNVLTDKSKYLKKDFLFINSSSFIENEFIRLIKIGILRREVDGQGLTSKVRITPIGRQVIKNNSNLYDQKQSIIRKLITCFKYQLIRR